MSTLILTPFAGIYETRFMTFTDILITNIFERFNNILERCNDVYKLCVLYDIISAAYIQLLYNLN